MRAAKTDTNQAGIVKDLRAIPGVEVDLNHNDILVGFRGVTYWFEVKNPDKVGKDGKIIPSAIRDSQVKLLDTWTGHYELVWSLEQILRRLGINEQVKKGKDIQA